MGLLDKIQAQQDKMQAVRGDLQKAVAPHASGFFEGVSYRDGMLHVKGKSYPMADCSMLIEQGADVRARGWTVTTGMIGSGKLKGHMRLHVTTPDGEQIVEFKADNAAKAEDFVSKFTKTVALLTS